VIYAGGELYGFLSVEWKVRKELIKIKKK
jgi:hypothetical protein